MNSQDYLVDNVLPSRGLAVICFKDEKCNESNSDYGSAFGPFLGT